MGAGAQYQSHAQSDTGQQLHPSRAGVVRHGGRIIDFLSTVVSLAVLSTLGFMQHLKATDRRERAGHGTSCSRGWRGREAGMAAGEMVVAMLDRRLPVTTQRQVLQSCTDPGLRRRGGASAAVHRQSVSSLVVNRDRYPSCFGCSSSWTGLLQFLGCATTVVVASGSSTLTRSSVCQWSRGWVAPWGLWKIFTKFLRACAVRLDLDVNSTSSLYLAATCPCALRSTETFGQFFHVKVDSERPAQFSPWKSEHFFFEQYLAVTVCVSLRSICNNFGFSS